MIAELVSGRFRLKGVRENQCVRVLMQSTGVTVQICAYSENSFHDMEPLLECFVSGEADILREALYAGRCWQTGTVNKLVDWLSSFTGDIMEPESLVQLFV